MIPTPSSQRSAPPPPAARPGRRRRAPIDAAEAFRDLPGLVLLESARPGRNARWTYLTADPVAVLESPAAGPDPFAVARRLVARLDRTRRRPGRRAAVPRRARRLPRLRPRAPSSSACRRSPRPTRTCRRCGSRSTTGSSPGTAGPATPGSAAGRSMATGAGSPAARRRPRPPDDRPPRGADAAPTTRRPRPARLPLGPRPGRLRGRRRARSATTSPTATSTRRT